MLHSPSQVTQSRAGLYRSWRFREADGCKTLGLADEDRASTLTFVIKSPLGNLLCSSLLLSACGTAFTACRRTGCSSFPARSVGPQCPRWPSHGNPDPCPFDHPWTERVHAARHDIIDEMATPRRPLPGPVDPPKEATRTILLSQGKPVVTPGPPVREPPRFCRSLPHKLSVRLLLAHRAGGRCILIRARRTPARRPTSPQGLRRHDAVGRRPEPSLSRRRGAGFRR